jgi:hypothetical protein
VPEQRLFFFPPFFPQPFHLRRCFYSTHWQRGTDFKTRNPARKSTLPTQKTAIGRAEIG